MAKKKTYKKTKKVSEVGEPAVTYEKRRIVFFNSFEEENEYTAKKRAEVPYDERMMNIEELRKRVFNKYLLPDNSWRSIKKVFKIMPPYTNDISQ